MDHNQQAQTGIREKFRRFAHSASQFMGSPWMFLVACLIIVGWGATGPLFHYSDTWQLVINTGTTIVTFLMVFLIQNTQNRDTRAIHLKLDELIRALKGARNQLVNLEEMSDEELDKLQAEFERVCGTRLSKSAGRSFSVDGDPNASEPQPGRDNQARSGAVVRPGSAES
jgi:low affinity Fe/Cu permease